MKQTADEVLKHTYRRKIIQQKCEIQESLWINDNIRLQIKKRKEYNRARRHATDPDERDKQNQNYLKQKKVQQLVKEEMYKCEMKITNEIKENRDTKKLWEAINKLKNVKQNHQMT